MKRISTGLMSIEHGLLIIGALDTGFTQAAEKIRFELTEKLGSHFEFVDDYPGLYQSLVEENSDMQKNIFSLNEPYEIRDYKCFYISQKTFLDNEKYISSLIAEKRRLKAIPLIRIESLSGLREELLDFLLNNFSVFYIGELFDSEKKLLEKKLPKYAEVQNRKNENSFKVSMKDNSIYIENSSSDFTEPIDQYFKGQLSNSTTSIEIYEDGVNTISYTIEPRDPGENLANKYANYHITIYPEKRVFLEAAIADTSDKNFDEKSDVIYRMQPMFLSTAEFLNEEFAGYGPLVRRHIRGDYTTATSTRLVVVCDACKKPFLVKHYHAGFMDKMYFYSQDGLRSAVIPMSAMNDFPSILKYKPIAEEVKKLDSKLLQLDKESCFAYYNNFNCRYCGKPVIDFRAHPHIRENEFHVYLHKDEKLVEFSGF